MLLRRSRTFIKEEPRVLEFNDRYGRLERVSQSIWQQLCEMKRNQEKHSAKGESRAEVRLAETGTNPFSWIVRVG
jgi:hypothetical protein